MGLKLVKFGHFGPDLRGDLTIHFLFRNYFIIIFQIFRLFMGWKCGFSATAPLKKGANP
jgi:hypothetical protein